MSRPKKSAPKHRRTRGEGSIFLRGNLSNEGIGIWSLVVSARQADPTGKRSRKWRSFRGTKEQAVDELARMRLEIKAGTYTDPHNEPLSKYLTESWLPHVKAQVSTRTYLRYAEIVHKHLVPALGNTPLTQLDAMRIEDTKRRWLCAGRVAVHRNGQALSPRTVTHHLRVLHASLEQARKWKLIVRNVAEDVDMPRVTKPRTRALEAQEAQLLLESARGMPRLHAAIHVLLSTGVRRGELLALRWSDFEEAAGIVRVRSSIEVSYKRLAFKEPKNGRSRAIKVGEPTVRVLTAHRKLQHSEIFARRRLGLEYASDLNLIFPRDDGTIWHPDSFARSVGNIVRAAKLGALRLHDLRHSSASLLIASGVPLKVVSERLGHSSISITADIYGHVYAAQQDRAAAAIDSLLTEPSALQEAT